MKFKIIIFAILLSGLCFAQESVPEQQAQPVVEQQAEHAAETQAQPAVEAAPAAAEPQVQPAARTSGVLSVKTSVPSGVWINGEAVGTTPFLMELPLGWQTYSVRAPGHWTGTYIVEMQPGIILSQEVEMRQFGLPSLEMPDISRERDIRVLERLYDSLAMANLETVPDSVCIQSFVQKYPLPALIPPGLTEKSPEYLHYYKLYDNDRVASFNEWYAGCSMPVQQNLSAIWARVNELGVERINGYVPAIAGRFVPSTPDGLNGNLVLIFRSADGRADVAWQGTWENNFLPGDDLVRALTTSEPLALSFLTVQNQTVWIPVEGGYSRHFYKYYDLTVSWNGLLIPLKGEFVLPDYLLANQVVADWLGKTDVPEVVPVVTPDSLAPARASIARIPGGTFKYKDKEMSMKPFGIHTGEINQKMYSETCGKKDFGKVKGDSIPAHSVTWNEANSCCKVLGGDLPTEAEWEYASRAGTPHDYTWAGNASEYAVFGEKKPAKIAGKKPNGWGLYDMFGNVSEWVKDDGFWFGKYKYLKGGSIRSKEKNLKVSENEEEDARYWGTHVGFRCIFRE